MGPAQIISSMSAFLHTTTRILADWLSDRLPRINDNWWNECVIDRLSHHQRERAIAEGVTTLVQLDLSALLRIADRSWYEIRSRFYLIQAERDCLKAMVGVRNNWAHCAGEIPGKDAIISDLGKMIQFSQKFGASNEVCQKMQNFMEELSSTIIGTPSLSLSNKEELPKKSSTSTETQITERSLVYLVSDPNKKGMVFSVNKIDGNIKYEVFINDSIQIFYSGQIMPADVLPVQSIAELGLLKSNLTAYQLKYPASTSLYSLNAARIDFVPYQFRPALKMIRSDVPRLMIADSVGVGKTIEAGLILKEMQARNDVGNVLIICPKPLVAERKWELEMKRFDEDFIPIDGPSFRQIIADIERDGVWPDRYNRAIIPYSLLGKEALFGTGQKNRVRSSRTAAGLIDLSPAPHFDMVIVDEAHHIRNSGTQTYAAVKYFCDHADAVIFLTATPLQTGDHDLFTLLNVLRPDVILDEETFRMMARPNPLINKAVHVIRAEASDWTNVAMSYLAEAALTQWGQAVIEPNPTYQSVIKMLSQKELSREDRIQLISDVESLHSFSGMINRTRRQDIQDFCVRRSFTCETNFTPNQRELHDELLAFEENALSLLHESSSIRFMMSTIKRQAASCIFGLAPFIRAIINRRLSQIWDDPEADADDMILDNASYNAFNAAAKHLLELADSLPEDDPKLESLLAIVNDKQKQQNNKIILFSTFKHTLAYIRERLIKTGLRIAQVDGSVKDEERYILRSRFELDRNDKDSIDIMLFTEVGSEGLDYQFCNTMINYDLPWNPMRIEQRIGRIDRRGQKSDVVSIYNMITSDTVDAEIYHRCLLRINIFEDSIGECSEILGEINSEIQNIIFDPSLTSEEKKLKLERMADNEIRRIQEMRRLEEEEKQLFGFNLTEYTMSRDIQEAENPWITSDAIQFLVEEYLRKIIREGSFLLGEGPLKTLRLSADARHILLEDLKKLPTSRSVVRRNWEAYLKSSKPNCVVTFDSLCAQQNRNAFFITNIHPLAKQAAEYFDITDVLYFGAEVSGSDLKPGVYPFAIFAWEYKGYKPQRKLKGICADPDVQSELLHIIKTAAVVSFDTLQYKGAWDALEGSHMRIWKEAKDEHRLEAEASFRYKSESLSNNFASRSRILRQQIAEISDDSIRRMRRSELENVEAKYNLQLNSLRQETDKADIHVRLLVHGVLFAKEA